MILDVVADADVAELGVAGGEERHHVSAKIHLRGEKEDQRHEEQRDLNHRGRDEGNHRGDDAPLRGFDGDGIARRQQHLLQLAYRGQRAIEHVELLLDRRADLRRPGDPLGERAGEYGHGAPGGGEQHGAENERRHPRRDPMARGRFDERRQRGADHQRRRHRQQQRAGEKQARPQQQNENSDGRHLRGRRPDVLDGLGRLCLLGRERVALLAAGAE